MKKIIGLAAIILLILACDMQAPECECNCECESCMLTTEQFACFTFEVVDCINQGGAAEICLAQGLSICTETE